MRHGMFCAAREYKKMQAWQIAGVGAASLAAAALVVATQRWHGRWTSDFQDSGVQKHHSGNPPRIGFVPIFVGLLAALYFLAGGTTATDAATYGFLLNIGLASTPIVLLGLVEDVTKKVSPRLRLLGALAAGAVAMFLFDNHITRVNVPGLDQLVQWAPIALALTMLMVGGFTNAVNIVDGLNGLASGLAVLMLAATAYVASTVGDTVVLNLCAVLAMAILGFMALNFPRGLLFLGDGGAYLIGFALVQIWMLLLMRNPEVSTWFVVAVAFHPTMETIFSMYRRRIHRGRGGAFTQADRLHLHTLVYRRRMLGMLQRMPWMDKWVPNSSASLAVLAFGGLPMLAVSFAPTTTWWCVLVLLTATAAYLLWFRMLVGFGAVLRVPSQAVPKGLQTASMNVSEPAVR